MARTLSLLFVSLMLMPLTGGTLAAQDAKAILQAVARNIGAENLRCLTYTGSGYVGVVGQNFTPRDDWPRVELASYTRTINFDTKSAREEQVRRQGSYPTRGGGGIPIQGEARQINLVSGNYAWALQGANATPQPAAAEQRQLDLWITPHGFLKAAMAAPKPVVEKYQLTDGTRTIDVHHVQGLNHVDGMLIAYLPKEKILIEADMYNVPAAGTPAPSPGAAAKTFLNNVRRLKLDVATLAPIHGPVIPWSDFMRIMGS